MAYSIYLAPLFGPDEWTGPYGEKNACLLAIFFDLVGTDRVPLVGVAAQMNRRAYRTGGQKSTRTTTMDRTSRRPMLARKATKQESKGPTAAAAGVALSPSPSSHRLAVATVRMLTGGRDRRRSSVALRSPRMLAPCGVGPCTATHCVCVVQLRRPTTPEATHV